MHQVNDFDYIAHLLVEHIEDPDEYYDANKIHKIRDKLSPEVGGLFQKIVAKFRHIA